MRVLCLTVEKLKIKIMLKLKLDLKLEFEPAAIVCLCLNLPRLLLMLNVNYKYCISLFGSHAIEKNLQQQRKQRAQPNKTKRYTKLNETLIV